MNPSRENSVMRQSFLSPAILKEGAAGPPVVNLQAALNLLPSVLAVLAVDGKFGPKTTARVTEFQRLARIAADGDVGPETMSRLLALIPDLNAAVAIHAQRTAVVALAFLERWGAGGLVNAVKAEALSEPGSNKRLRKGYPRLLEYFRLSDPNEVFARTNIKYLAQDNTLAPCPHWCGIFAVWAHKAAGTRGLGNWVQGVGISAVTGFRRLGANEIPMPADVGYLSSFNHHVLVRRACPGNSGSLLFDTVEGNSSPGSVIATRERSPASRFEAFYRAKSLDIQ